MMALGKPQAFEYVGFLPFTRLKVMPTVACVAGVLLL